MESRRKGPAQPEPRYIVPDDEWRLVPCEPSPRMVAASMGELQRYRDSFSPEEFAKKARLRGEHLNVWVTPFEKHLMRLRAALSVAPTHPHAETWGDRIDRKRARRMETVDRLQPDIREVVHDYGLHLVQTFMGLGVRDPVHIRALVETVLDEMSPTRSSNSIQGQTRAPAWTPPAELKDKATAAAEALG